MDDLGRHFPLSREVRLGELIVVEHVGCSVEQGRKGFFDRGAVDPVDLGKNRIPANGTK